MISTGGYFRASVRRFLELPPVWLGRHGFTNAAGERKTADIDGGHEASAPAGSSEAPARSVLHLANAEERQAGISDAPAEESKCAKGAASRQAPASSCRGGAAVARMAHNHEVAGSSPAPATSLEPEPALTPPAEDVPARVVSPCPSTGGHDPVCTPMVSTPVDRVAHGATARRRPPVEVETPRPAAIAIPKTERISIAGISSAMDQRADRAAAIATTDRANDEPEGKTRCRCAGEYHFVPAWFGRDCIEAACPLRVAA